MPRILAVDDDRFVRRIITRVLQGLGHVVTSAADGEEALRLARETPFSLALVDYEMPGIHGLQVLSRLREIQPGCLRVLMTGRQDFPVVVEAVNRGSILAVLQKPFTERQLLDVMDEAFASAQRMAEVVELQKRSVRDAERRMLQEAIEGDMLSLALQPIAKATKVPEVIGYEALLRSSHSVLNGPLPLLRAAERTGQLTEIARAVSECAANCLELIPSNRVLFVNLHPEELTDLDVARGSLSPLIPYADRVVLEITERVRLQTIGNWEEAVKELAATGFRLAVDDLGSGYNSLSILADLQPRFIKADMSIVRNLDREPRKQRLIELLARFAEATDALLIAEGVEEEAEFEALRTCAAHLVQGYWIGRPEMDIERLLSEAV